MTTKYETALNEFRDASAAVRLAFAALSEAREIQILANRGHDAANRVHIAATARLDAADAALRSVQPEAPAGADIDFTKPNGVMGNAMGSVTGLKTGRNDDDDIVAVGVGAGIF